MTHWVDRHGHLLSTAAIIEGRATGWCPQCELQMVARPIQDEARFIDEFGHELVDVSARGGLLSGWCPECTVQRPAQRDRRGLTDVPLRAVTA